MGPALAAVAMASVAITARSLDLADDAVARSRADGALRLYAQQLADGDRPAEALRLALRTIDADGARLVVRVPEVPGGSAERADGMPLAFRDLAPGVCADARDEHGTAWHGCAVREVVGEKERVAIAAILVQPHRTVVRELAAGMLGIVVLVLLAIVAATRMTVRRPLEALNELVTWSEHIVDRETLPPAPRATGTTEVARLVASFEGLVQRLFNAIGRERATAAHIAHELRTPLTGLRIELEKLLADGTAPAAESAIERMLTDVDRLTRVIQSILVLSAPKENARPGEIVVNVADLARDLAPKGATIDAPDEALVHADPRLVELALRNLVDNARKYGGGAGARIVRVSRAGGAVRLSVIDEGPGVDAEGRTKMFDRYWRAATDRSGSGLGLALVRAVAERHRGHVEANPGPGGKGLEVAMTMSPLLEWHDEDSEEPKKPPE